MFQIFPISLKLRKTVIIFFRKRGFFLTIGRYNHEPDGWFNDDDIITPQTILRVKCVPYYWQFDYDPYNPRSAPQYGRTYYPPAILAQYQQAGIDISSLN